MRGLDVTDVQCVRCGALPCAPCTREAWWWERLLARLRNRQVLRVPIRPHIVRYASRALAERQGKVNA